MLESLRPLVGEGSGIGSSLRGPRPLGSQTPTAGYDLWLLIKRRHVLQADTGQRSECIVKGPAPGEGSPSKRGFEWGGGVSPKELSRDFKWEEVRLGGGSLSLTLKIHNFPLALSFHRTL